MEPEGRVSRPQSEGDVMTNQHPATVADSLTVHGDVYEGDVEKLIDHWSKLDARLRSFDSGTVAMQLFVKDRDSKSQQVTLDVKVDGHAPLVAKSSNTDLDRAFNEVRDEMIRQLTDMKTKTEPRNNKHLRSTD
jgi:ribosome-associated translation inhibitor RaiA